MNAHTIADVKRLSESPKATFVVLMIIGLLFGILLTFGYTSPPSTVEEYPSWLLPAAGVFATIAVATILPDLPDLRGPEPNQGQDSAAVEYIQQRLKLGQIILHSTGTLAATCCVFALFESFEAPSQNTTLSQIKLGAEFPQAIITALAHVVVVGVCSLGLGYKQEAFLRDQSIEWIRLRYVRNEGGTNTWVIRWGIPHARLKLIDNCSYKGLLAAKYASIGVLVMLLLLGFIRADNPEFSAFGLFVYTLLHSIILLGSYFFIEDELIEREVTRRQYPASVMEDNAKLPRRYYPAVFFVVASIVIQLLILFSALLERLVGQNYCIATIVATTFLCVVLPCFTAFKLKGIKFEEEDPADRRALHQQLARKAHKDHEVRLRFYETWSGN